MKKPKGDISVQCKQVSRAVRSNEVPKDQNDMTVMTNVLFNIQRDSNTPIVNMYPVINFGNQIPQGQPVIVNINITLPKF